MSIRSCVVYFNFSDTRAEHCFGNGGPPQRAGELLELWLSQGRNGDRRSQFWTTRLAPAQFWLFHIGATHHFGFDFSPNVCVRFMIFTCAASSIDCSSFDRGWQLMC